MLAPRNTAFPFPKHQIVSGSAGRRSGRRCFGFFEDQRRSRHTFLHGLHDLCRLLATGWCWQRRSEKMQLPQSSHVRCDREASICCRARSPALHHPLSLYLQPHFQRSLGHSSCKAWWNSKARCQQLVVAVPPQNWLTALRHIGNALQSTSLPSMRRRQAGSSYLRRAGCLAVISDLQGCGIRQVS